VQLLEDNKNAKLPLSTAFRHAGDGGVSPLILNRGTRWRCEVNFRLRPLLSPGQKLGNDPSAKVCLVEKWTEENIWKNLKFSDMGVEVKWALK
jgi:hypothetical protein